MRHVLCRFTMHAVLFAVQGFYRADRKPAATYRQPRLVRTKVYSVMIHVIIVAVFIYTCIYAVFSDELCYCVNLAVLLGCIVYLDALLLCTVLLDRAVLLVYVEPLCASCYAYVLR